MGEDQYVVTVGLPELDGLLRGLNKNARSACLCVSNGGGGTYKHFLFTHEQYNLNIFAFTPTGTTERHGPFCLFGAK